MIAPLTNLVRRDAAHPLADDHTVLNLLTVLLVLVLLVLLLIAGLLFMRQRRRARQPALLPLHDGEKRVSTTSSHRRIMVRPSRSVSFYSEKQRVPVHEAEEADSDDEEDDGRPTSPLPEIRITFPEEVDSSGKRQSGRVVVVHVGDSGVGMGPVTEKLPAYAKDGERYHSIDLERIGGLVEKARNAPRSWA